MFVIVSVFESHRLEVSFRSLIPITFLLTQRNVCLHEIPAESKILHTAAAAPASTEKE